VDRTFYPDEAQLKEVTTFLKSRYKEAGSKVAIWAKSNFKAPPTNGALRKVVNKKAMKAI
jgi:hypothetical protein